MAALAKFPESQDMTLAILACLQCFIVFTVLLAIVGFVRTRKRRHLRHEWATISLVLVAQVLMAIQFQMLFIDLRTGEGWAWVMLPLLTCVLLAWASNQQN